MEGIFPDRAEAGRLLGVKLSKYAGRDDVIVLGLPRGGVPVAYEVAQALRVPLDVFIVRKLGVPGFEELAVVRRLETKQLGGGRVAGVEKLQRGEECQHRHHASRQEYQEPAAHDRFH